MSAVTMAVRHVLVRNETLLGRYPAGQVGVFGVDAGVQDGDVHALPGVAGLPRLRCADLGG